MSNLSSQFSAICSVSLSQCICLSYSVYADVEERINTFRTMLQTKLLELPTPLEEQKKLIRSNLFTESSKSDFIYIIIA